MKNALLTQYLTDLCGGFRRICPGAVPAGLFCPVQSHVGGFQKFVLAAAVDGVGGYADAAAYGGEVNAIQRRDVGARHCLPYPLGNFYGGLGIGGREGGNEFIASVSCQEIGFADALQYQSGKLDQDVVSGTMAIGVVDLFEMVYVDGQDAQVLVEKACRFDLVIQVGLKKTSVVNLGEIVYGSLLTEGAQGLAVLDRCFGQDDRQCQVHPYQHRKCDGVRKASGNRFQAGDVKHQPVCQIP